MPVVQPAPDLAQRLGQIALPEADGGRVQLGTLWQKQTTVLVHLRHFG